MDKDRDTGPNLPKLQQPQTVDEQGLIPSPEPDHDQVPASNQHQAQAPAGDHEGKHQQEHQLTPQMEKEMEHGTTIYNFRNKPGHTIHYIPDQAFWISIYTFG